MNNSLFETLNSISNGLAFVVPELVLTGSLLLFIILGLFKKQIDGFLHAISGIIFILALSLVLINLGSESKGTTLFAGVVRVSPFSQYLKVLFDLSAGLTVFMTWKNHIRQPRLAEYYALIVTMVLGAHLLVMSENLLILFLALELVSIPSYILAGFSFDKKATEGSFKYFIFGSVASAVMIYGFSVLYGITGTANFTSTDFFAGISHSTGTLLLIGCFFSLAGLLYKIAAAPMHPWAPDVYEAASMPIVAIFSTVPKLAGVGILAKFLLSASAAGSIDWQFVLALIIMLTLTIGNFSALAQRNVKRLMAYSSIAQSGFLLIGVVAFSAQSIHFLLFYATIYVITNYLVFFYLQYFEKYRFTSIADYEGAGRSFAVPAIFVLIGFVSLTGLPPTAGFTGKLFIFTGLWDAYAITHKHTLLILFIFGLLNTVVSLFYYLRIPYFALVRPSNSHFAENNLTSINLLGAILVLVILICFFSPGLLMGWINKINFAF